MKTNRYVWVRGPRQVALVLATVVIAGLLALTPACGFVGDGEADITVVNQTSGTIITLQFKNDRDSSWSIDQLRGIDLQPSQTFVIRDVGDTDYYDIQATDEEGFTYTVTRVRVSFSDETVTLSDGDITAGPGELTIINDTDVAWDALYIKDGNADAWGGSILGPAVQPGTSLSVPRDINERFSLRAEGGDQQVFEVLNVRMNSKSKELSVASATLVTIGEVTVANGIDYGNGGDNSIMAVFLRRAGTQDWGPDLLVGSIGNTQSEPFEVEPGVYDLKVVDVSGKTYQRFNLDVVAGWPVEVALSSNDVLIETP